MLQPVTNQSRLALSLNGLWNFSLVDIHYNPIHPLENSRMIGVPGSYNDLFTEKEIRDYVGKVCYEKTIEVPSLHTNWRLRIGAAGH
ncbi:MAG: beta-glucuronidase, partial [Candidatus Izemoplasmatales bacterium]